MRHGGVERGENRLIAICPFLIEFEQGANLGDKSLSFSPHMAARWASSSFSRPHLFTRPVHEDGIGTRLSESPAATSSAERGIAEAASTAVPVAVAEAAVASPPRTKSILGRHTLGAGARWSAFDRVCTRVRVAAFVCSGSDHLMDHLWQLACGRQGQI